MIKIKIYEYDSTQEANHYRGTDYSAYVKLGETITDDLSEVMGTAELTLAGLPSRRTDEIKTEEFAPKTKFIIDAIDTTVSETDPTLTWDMIVQEDVVEKPILSDDNYYDHHITFIEASADAQGRLVDNIAITYKLQNVNLNGDTVINTSQTIAVNPQNVTGKPLGTYNQFEVDTERNAQISLGKKLVWRFPTWLPNSTSDPDYWSENAWRNFKYYQAVPADEDSVPVDLPVPMLEILNGVNGTSSDFEHMGYCSIRTVVTEENLITHEKQVVVDMITNPNKQVATEGTWTSDWAGSTADGEIIEGIGLLPNLSTVYTRKTVATFDNAPFNATAQNRRIKFDAKKNCSYTIQIFLKDNFIFEYNQEAKAQVVFWVVVIGWEVGQQKYSWTNNNSPAVITSFTTYEAGSNNKVVLQQAPEENAYNLFQKAQLNTQNVDKQWGLSITETPQAYYIEGQEKLELQNTQVVENFYNQKNFWEILLEIGKYIHAIPKVEFGSDNRFVVRWQKLGQTTQKEDNSTKITIFNSKSMENYVSACSSYITNMVQLGGVIEEWVTPKSSSEDYLVYNDVAEIHTNKPIIEIVSMEAKCVNNNYGISSGSYPNLTASMTPLPTPVEPHPNGYIFEENVYNVLSLNGNDKANKGLAVYYELGTNIIKGLNFQLPTVSSGDLGNDYAMKNILGTIFNISQSNWKNIKVNDFQFHIVYRTKDTARSDQTRPDLRKYAIASKYDRVPQHNQFNNQQDVVIDSNKFGNNIYGKLIRTGNTNYTVTEWNDNLLTLKQVGELYNINGELYYVVTVKNTFFNSHIISEITFSKDYNQLSEIIGIPSEPRFYEISEQSLIEREVPLNDYIVLGTSPIESDTKNFVQQKGWNYIADLLFKNETEFPKYAVSVFKNDIDRVYTPPVAGNETFYKEVCHPISTYSIQNTLTMEWDMIDNFSAGDKVQPTNNSLDGKPVDGAYYTLNPVQYTDVYGRSDLVDFFVMKNIPNLSDSDVRNLPESPLRTRYGRVLAYGGNIEATYPNRPTDSDLTAKVVETLGRQPQEGDGVFVKYTTSLNEVFYYIKRYGTVNWGSIEYEITEYEYERAISGQVDFAKKSILTQMDNYLFGNESEDQLGTNERGLALLKDNREKISFNYNLQMLTDSDRFVLSSWLWQPAKGNLRLALLNTEINKISNDTISDDIVITDEYIIYDEDQNIDLITDTDPLTVPISTILNGVDLTDVKALAIISDVEVAGSATSGARYFVMGRNITGLDTSDITGTLTPEQAKDKAKADWYISSYDKAMFPHQ